MRFIFRIVLAFVVFTSFSNNTDENSSWTDAELAAANTAKNETYITQEEKNIFLYANLARLYPVKFAKMYLPDGKIKKFTNVYENSLVKTLNKMKPVTVLLPDGGNELYQSALCHAKDSGKRGYVGHDRKKCKEYFSAECCSYGYNDGLGVILQLLIDKDVSSLGHRKAMLNGVYKKMGLSIQPHKKHNYTAVLDLM
jgi:uncharacterized protein YkwD